MKPFLMHRQTKDRFGVMGAFGFTFPSSGKEKRLNLKTLCILAKARAEEEISGDLISHLTLADHAQLLGWAVQVLHQSNSAKIMLEEAANSGWSVELDDLDSHDFHLDVPEKHIILNTHGLGAVSLSKSEYFRNLILVSLTRALRDVWQEKRHGGFEENYGPESILMLERVRAADCDAITILVAWELRQAKLTDLWRHVLGSDEGDLAMTFASTMKNDINNWDINTALSSTFRQWFASEDRMNVCDHETLEYLDDLIAQESKSVFGQEYLRPHSLEILSCLPDKTAYLQGHGVELVSDPLYSGMNDAINQSHFSHIMHDMQAITVSGIPFRSESLAEKMFPEINTALSVNA